jgi:hypothetical protein
MYFFIMHLSLDASAGTVFGYGHGGDIPAGAPLKKSGVFRSDAVMSGTGVVASGNAVTVVLKGLQHDWPGDLIATLSYIDGQGNTVASANVFYRIGQTTNRPGGAWAGFGIPGGIGDNYYFNSAFKGDIWSEAATAGYADAIPGQQANTANHGRYFTTDANGAGNNLSSAFSGLNIAGGTWRLTIRDISDHAAEGGTTPNTGSLVSWEICIENTN